MDIRRIRKLMFVLSLVVMVLVLGACCGPCCEEIAITSPAPGTQITSPVTVMGMATIPFEGAVTVRMWDIYGQQIGIEGGLVTGGGLGPVWCLHRERAVRRASPGNIPATSHHHPGVHGLTARMGTYYISAPSGANSSSRTRYPIDKMPEQGKARLLPLLTFSLIPTPTHLGTTIGTHRFYDVLTEHTERGMLSLGAMTIANTTLRMRMTPMRPTPFHPSNRRVRKQTASRAAKCPPLTLSGAMIDL